ncbi:MAG: GNAT family N-acetyltransferase [Leptospiraceae bacterium]|nr:GNAT family N-acetyltransferase [Leptospiraceae bacterium]
MNDSKLRVIKINQSNVELVFPLFAKYRKFYEVESHPINEQEFLKRRIEKNESKIFIVQSGEESIGFTQLYPSFSSLSLKSVWILNDLYVEEQYRKQGVGKMLLDAAKNFAIQTKSKGLTLTTGIENTVAQSLYEKYGFIRNDHFYEYFLFF